MDLHYSHFRRDYQFVILFLFGFFSVIQPVYATSLPGIIVPTSYVFFLVGWLSVYIWLYRASLDDGKQISLSTIISENSFSFFMIVPVYFLLLNWDAIAVKYVIYGKSITYVDSPVYRILLMLGYFFAVYLAIILLHILEAVLQKDKCPSLRDRCSTATRRSTLPIVVCVSAFTLTALGFDIFSFPFNLVLVIFFLVPFILLLHANKKPQNKDKPLRLSWMWSVGLLFIVFVFLLFFPFILEFTIGNI